MKSLYTTKYGGPDVLQVREEPDPEPGPRHVRIRVERAGLNFADVAARVGLYPDAPKPPMVVGYEVAGKIDAVGPDVNGVQIGDRVLAMTRFKGQATHAVVPAKQIVPLPPQMSFDDAAALPVNYLTAFHMVHRVARVRPGEKVLIHMAGGGVGLALIQLCKRIDGVVMFGTASEAKHAFLRDMGLTHPIDYRQMDYGQEVLRITNNRGPNVIFDPLGGKDWKKGYALLAPAGHLVAFGWSNMVVGAKRNPLNAARQFLQMKRYSPLKLMGDNKTVSGVNMGHLWDEHDLIMEEMAELMNLYLSGKIRPRVDKVFPLAAAADAHNYIQGRKNVGKVLFDCSDS